MMRSTLLPCLLLSASAVCMTPALAADADGCTQFKWNVSHEVALMKESGRRVTAASKADVHAPQITLDALYDLKLSPQSSVTFAAKPGKDSKVGSPMAGLVRFHISKAGLYRVSITSGHWIDVVDGEELLKSRDYQGNHGCSRPHKIVEYDLPANKDLILQLSGGEDSPVSVTITPAAS
jgi:hypothetical protein